MVSACAVAAAPLMIMDPLITVPGGNPVMEVPGSTPKFPLMMEAPVLVTAEPPKMVKVPAVPKSENVTAFMDQDIVRRMERIMVATCEALDLCFIDYFLAPAQTG
jgi:hypothetical protein